MHSLDRAWVPSRVSRCRLCSLFVKMTCDEVFPTTYRIEMVLHVIQKRKVYLLQNVKIKSIFLRHPFIL